MLIEFQIRTNKLLALVRERIKRKEICIPDRFAIEALGNQPDFLVDHFRLLDTTRIERTPSEDKVIYATHHVQATGIRIVQPVELFIAHVKDLTTAKDQPLPSSGSGAYFEATVELEFNLTVGETKDGLELRITYDDMVAVKPPGPVPEDLRQLMQGRMQALQMKTPINLSALEKFVTNMSVSHAGVGASTDLSFIAMRIEIHTLDFDAAPWEKFYNGAIDDHLVVTWSEPVPVEFDDKGHPVPNPEDEPIVHTFAGEWSMFIDQQMIVPHVNAILKSELEKSDQFTLLTEVDAFWDCAGHLPRIIMNFGGDVRNLGALSQSVYVDIKATSLLSALPDNTLQTYTGFDWDADDWDIFFLGLANVVLVGAIGATLGGVLGGPVGALVGLVAGLVAGVIGAIIGFGVASVGQLPPPANCHQPGEAAVVCTEAFAVPSNDIFGTLTFNSVFGLCTGPLLLGNLSKVTEADEVKIDEVTVTPPTWGYKDPCGVPLLAVSAEIYLSHLGNVPLVSCAITSIGSDSLSQFTPLNAIMKVTPFKGEQLSDITIEITIPADKVKPLYANLANPYPLILLIQTNGGSRVITLPGFHALSAQQKAALDQQLIVDKALCIEVSETFSAGIGPYFPEWTVGFPALEPATVAVHLWQVAAQGLAADESLSLIDRSGEVVNTSPLSAGGLAQVAAVVSPETQIGIVRNTPRVGRTPPDANPVRRLMVQQTILLRACVLEFDHAVQGVVGERLGGRPMLFCMTACGRHYLYDLSIPHYPALVRQVFMPGLRGVMRWKDGFAIWGGQGLQLLTHDANCPDRPHRRREVRRPVRGVVEVEGHLCPIMDDETCADEQRPPSASKPKFVDAPWFDGSVRLGRTLARPNGSAVEVWNIWRYRRLG